jgi:DNA-binding winged helix-turn-helix (wHTH) protein
MNGPKSDVCVESARLPTADTLVGAAVARICARNGRRPLFNRLVALASSNAAPMHSGSPRTLSFSCYVLDLQRCALMHGDQEIQLRPKSFDVLRYLAEHAGRLVSKEELIKASWPDTFVTDDSLVQCIKDIREALADGDHQIIKTVPRRGYLFAAELSNVDTMVVATAARAPEITFCRTKDGVNLAVGCVGQGMPLLSVRPKTF